MTTTTIETGESTLNARELLGLLSARLIHSLSNHLMVMSGNLCVATKLENEPAQLSAVLQGALQAANQVGVLLDQFAACRRSIKDDLGRTSVKSVVSLLHSWASRNGGWILEVDPESRKVEDGAILLSPNLLIFILDAIAREIQASEGVLRLSRTPAKALAWPSPFPMEGAGSLQVSLTYHAPESLDWDNIRSQLSCINLAAACEILSQARAKPASVSVASGLQRTMFTLALE